MDFQSNPELLEKFLSWPGNLKTHPPPVSQTISNLCENTASDGGWGGGRGAAVSNHDDDEVNDDELKKM